MKMENYITSLNSSRQEAEMRRSAVITEVCLLAMVALAGIGLWALLAHGSELAFYGLLAVAALLYDPFRRHLNA